VYGRENTIPPRRAVHWPSVAAGQWSGTGVGLSDRGLVTADLSQSGRNLMPASEGNGGSSLARSPAASPAASPAQPRDQPSRSAVGIVERSCKPAMLRLLHTADVHLGARHADMGERAASQRERQFQAFQRSVDLALSEKVDQIGRAHV